MRGGICVLICMICFSLFLLNRHNSQSTPDPADYLDGKIVCDLKHHPLMLVRGGGELFYIEPISKSDALCQPGHENK